MDLAGLASLLRPDPTPTGIRTPGQPSVESAEMFNDPPRTGRHGCRRRRCEPYANRRFRAITARLACDRAVRMIEARHGCRSYLRGRQLVVFTLIHRRLRGSRLRASTSELDG